MNIAAKVKKTSASGEANSAPLLVLGTELLDEGEDEVLDAAVEMPELVWEAEECEAVELELLLVGVVEAEDAVVAAEEVDLTVANEVEEEPVALTVPDVEAETVAPRSWN